MVLAQLISPTGVTLQAVPVPAPPEWYVPRAPGPLTFTRVPMQVRAGMMAIPYPTRHFHRVTSACANYPIYVEAC